MKIERYIQRCQGWFPGYAIVLEQYKVLWNAYRNDIDLPEEDEELTVEEALIQLLMRAEQRGISGAYVFIGQFADFYCKISGQQMDRLSQALNDAFIPPQSERE